MASAALEWPKKTAARAYGSLARLRRRSILIYQKTHLIVAPIQSRTQCGTLDPVYMRHAKHMVPVYTARKRTERAKTKQMYTHTQSRRESGHPTEVSDRTADTFFSRCGGSHINAV